MNTSPLHHRQGFVDCHAGEVAYRMAYHEYWQQGDAQAPAADLPVLFCVHGLTRVGADFASVAQVMSQTHRVICPDIVGRGDSDWLPANAPSSHYQLPQYAADMQRLAQTLNLREADWLGTSMGGLIGLLVAMQAKAAENTTPAASAPLRLRTLILNDIGIRIPKESLQLIAGYVGKAPAWAKPEEALGFYQNNYAAFGINALADWQKFTADSIRYRNGAWRAHYDPRIAEPFSAGIEEDVDLTHIFDTLTLPMLVLRGEHSNLLLDADYQTMCQRPNIQGVVFPHCGHAPALIDPKQITPLQTFVASPPFIINNS